jgi:hypothetical protein
MGIQGLQDTFSKPAYMVMGVTPRGFSVGLAGRLDVGVDVVMLLCILCVCSAEPLHKSVFCPWAGFAILHFMEVFLLYASLYGEILEKLSYVSNSKKRTTILIWVGAPQ